MPLLSLSEAKTSLNITGSTHDEELADYIAAAVEAVDFLCGPTEPVTVTEVVRGGGQLILRTTPVLAVTSIVGRISGAVDVDEVDVSERAGVLSGFDDAFDVDRYTVTYTAGRATVPASIKIGARIILRHQWETQRGATRRASAPSPDTSMVPGLGYAIPNRALQILDPYMKGPSVA